MKAFAKQLMDMEVAEASLRERLLSEGALSAGYHPELRALHEEQADKAAAVVADKGWPTAKALGWDAYDALFMVALNAISRPEWMRRAYLGFSEAKDDMSKGYAAYLSDRIAYFERRPQRYGTQWDVTVEGETVLWPVVEPEGLDQRRAQVGLDAFEELDFSLVELDLGQGLKRVLGQYDFMYQVGWLCPSHGDIRRLMRLLSDYSSGGLMGPDYSQQHYQGTLSEHKGPMDMVMPLQHKDAFEAFLRDEGHTVIAKGLKHGTYALKDDQGYLELKVYFIAFVEGEGGWCLEGFEGHLDAAQCHTVNGWLMSESSLQRGRSLSLF